MKNLLCFFFIAFCLVAMNAQNGMNISYALQEKMTHYPEAEYEVVIILNDQAPVAEFLDEAKMNNRGTEDFRISAITQMQETANRSQPELVNWLSGVVNIRENEIRKFWIVNALGVETSADNIYQIADHPMVRYIAEPPNFEETKWKRSFAPAGSLQTFQHEEGLDVINAPALWKMGYTGYGTKAYVYDTGIDIEHPALRSNFSYHSNPLEVSWKGLSEEPYTCTNHGTHVTGIIMGLDRVMNDTIGVAFNAQYMMSPQFTSCGSSRLGNIEAWEWVLDPDNNPLTVDEIPDAANMSGGSRVTDTICGDELFTLLFQGLQIGNVGAIFAGGNEGPGDSSHRSPAVHNLDLVHAFAVGNLDASTLEINPSSSRGPSFCFSTESSLEIKPEVSAPGTSVRSSIVGGGYDWFSGTSMAAPHVAGAFLLLKEAFPFLSETEILLALYHSAIDYGDVGEDNVYGKGVIDVLAAFHYLEDQGHQPVPPLPNHQDVAAVSLEVDSRNYCSTIPSIKVQFENAGTDTVFGVRLDFFERNGLIDSFSMEWPDPMAPDEIAELEFELPGEISSGLHELTMRLSIPGNNEEVRFLNNQFKKRYRIFNEPNLSVELADPESTSICNGSRVILQTNLNLDDNQNINWFGNDPSSSPLGAGPNFLTPIIMDTQLFHAELETNYKTGLFLEDAQLEYGEENLGGLIFDADRPFTLKQLKVHTGTNGGGRMIQLFDGNGESVISKLSILSPGEETITLNWPIDAGKGYRLEITTGKPFGHVIDQNIYPIKINDLVTIQSGVYDGTASQDTYYYFFDWEIMATHPCGPASIEVMPIQTDTIAPLEILSERDTVYLSDGGLIALEANGEDFISFQWDLGNGIESTGSDILAEYFDAGHYVVVLKGETTSGCSSTAMKDLVVIDDLQTSVKDQNVQNAEIKIFPNPAQKEIFIQDDRDQFLSEIYDVSIYDMLGRIVLAKEVNFNDGIARVDISSIPTGQFIVNVNGRNAIILIQ